MIVKEMLKITGVNRTLEGADSKRLPWKLTHNDPGLKNGSSKRGLGDIKT